MCKTLSQSKHSKISEKSPAYYNYCFFNSQIRFPLITPDDLDERVQSVDYMKTDCMELLFEASKYHMLPNKQPLLDSQRTRVRGAGPCLLALGGKGNKLCEI